MRTILTIPSYFLLLLISRRHLHTTKNLESELRRLWREIDADRRQTREERTLLEQRVWRRMGEMQRIAELNANQIEALVNSRK